VSTLQQVLTLLHVKQYYYSVEIQFCKSQFVTVRHVIDGASRESSSSGCSSILPVTTATATAVAITVAAAVTVPQQHASSVAVTATSSLQ
jgi:hypothetical protein